MRTAAFRLGSCVASARGRQAGLLLIECLVYIGLWLVIVGFGFSLFYGTWGATRNLARGADDVVRSLRVGEHWRAEIRGAAGDIRLEAGAGSAMPVLVIPRDQGDIGYAFTGTNVVRRVGGAGGKWHEALARVQASRFLRETNADVVSWRWELELRRPDTKSKRKPLLTFQAVEGGEAQR